MTAVLMTLFAVSILGALGMAIYGLRVLVGRWDQPRQHQALLSVPKLPPLNPLQPQPRSQQPQPRPRSKPQPPAPVWVPPAGSAPAPLVAPVGLATPPPIMLPTGLPPVPPTFMPPQPGIAPAAPAPLVFMPPQPGIAAPPSSAGADALPPLRVLTPPSANVPPVRSPSPGRPVARALSPRLARGSVPPDYSGSPEVDADTDPGLSLEAIVSSDTVVQQGARFSVVRSNRR
jgi:hypothetical protein